MLNETVHEISQKFRNREKINSGVWAREEDAQKMKENFWNDFDLFYSEYLILFGKLH